MGISNGTTGREHQLLHLLLLLTYIKFYKSWTTLKPHKMEEKQASGGKPSGEIVSSLVRIFAINRETDYFSGPFLPYIALELLVIWVYCI